MVSGLTFAPCRVVWIHRDLLSLSVAAWALSQQYCTCLGCNKGCSWLLCSSEWDFIFACYSKQTKQNISRGISSKIKNGWVLASFGEAMGSTVPTSLMLCFGHWRIEGAGVCSKLRTLQPIWLSIYQDILLGVMQRLDTVTFGFSALQCCYTPVLAQRTS